MQNIVSLVTSKYSLAVVLGHPMFYPLFCKRLKILALYKIVIKSPKKLTMKIWNRGKHFFIRAVQNSINSPILVLQQFMTVLRRPYYSYCTIRFNSMTFWFHCIPIMYVWKQFQIYCLLPTVQIHRSKCRLGTTKKCIIYICEPQCDVKMLLMANN